MNKEKTEHYHVCLMTKDNKIKELLVAQMEKNRWEVINYWEGKTLKDDFYNGKDAVKYAIELLQEKFDGYIMKGAGSPPDKWINEFSK